MEFIVHEAAIKTGRRPPRAESRRVAAELTRIVGRPMSFEAMTPGDTVDQAARSTGTVLFRRRGV